MKGKVREVYEGKGSSCGEHIKQLGDQVKWGSGKEIFWYQGEEGSVMGIHQSRRSDRVGCKSWMKKNGLMTMLVPSALWGQ